MPNPFGGWGGGMGDVDRHLKQMLASLASIEGKLDRTQRSLDQVLRNQQRGKEFLMSQAEELANLTAKVKANKDATDSAAMAMNGMVQSMQEVQRQLQEAIANAGADVSPEIKAAADAVQANTDALVAAIPQLAVAVPLNT